MSTPEKREIDPSLHFLSGIQFHDDRLTFLKITANHAWGQSPSLCSYPPHFLEGRIETRVFYMEDKSSSTELYCHLLITSCRSYLLIPLQWQFELECFKGDFQTTASTQITASCFCNLHTFLLQSFVTSNILWEMYHYVILSVWNHRIYWGKLGEYNILNIQVIGR